MTKPLPLSLMLLVAVLFCSTVPSYKIPNPERKIQEEGRNVKSSTYQSSISISEVSTESDQFLSVRKPGRPENNILMPVRKQQIRVEEQKKVESAVTGDSRDVSEERKPSESVAWGMAFDSRDSTTEIFKVAELKIFDKNCSVEETRECSRILDTVDGNVEKSKPHKRFPCSPCNCFHISKSYVQASCARLNLTDVPSTLPNKIRSLNMSLNILESFNTDVFLRYPSLECVSVAANRHLKSILNNTIVANRTTNVRLLDFSKCAIDTVYDASFATMPKLINLTLKHNHLKFLSKSAFTGLGCLQILDLSKNELIKIEVGTFDNLHRLVELNLSGNRLGYSSETFSPSMFTKLEHLQRLYIHGNTNGTENSYPNMALQQLKALQNLSIDGLAGTVQFGQEMKDLDRLVHLEIQGTCKIKIITDTFFKNVPHLQFLSISNCYVEEIHLEANAGLSDLRSLRLSYVPVLSLDDAFQAMSGLDNSGLKSLTFRNLRRYVEMCTYLTREHSKYITNMNLHHLDLSHNNIADIKYGFLTGLPKTLKELILNGNKLAFLTGTRTWEKFAVLKELTYFDLSMQNTNDFYDNRYSRATEDSPGLDCTDRQHLGSNEERIQLYDTRDNVVPIQAHVEYVNGNSHVDNLAIHCYPRSADKTCGTLRQEATYLDFPPNLRTLQVSHYQGFGMTILAHELPDNISLSEVDFSNSFMSKWGSGTLPRGIVTANLGDNYCKHICPGFFQANNSHEQLYLHNNLLGSHFAKDTSGSTFAELTLTTDLDISRNLIYHLPRELFQGLLHLKSLRISENRLTHLEVSFRHMTKLQFIDLSKNFIRWIDQETRNDLDVIAAGHTLEIDLTMNPLPCTCSGLDIVAWMATTKVHFRKPHLLTCDSDEISGELLGNLEVKKNDLQRFCMYKAVFIIGCVAATTVILTTVGLGLMYRYRWKLRYLHNNAMATIFGFKPDALPKSGCTFDAYIVYTKESQDFVLGTLIEELELKRGHRICVEDRDFLVGTYTVSNIVSAVRNSTKTVPVMTPQFYDGVYSEYSFKMAVMEELYKNRSVLHLLLYEPIPHEQMSHDELKVMKRNSYIEYPPQEETTDNIRQKFWDDLSQTIGHTENSKSQPLPDMLREGFR